ncbi:MAG: stage II sporulation protein M [Candidatus Aenigmarchaeota archaeon]|nr:stage II sporulation protein M [Candidatus Aenigmarchaeota archaeon]MCX8179123.1 stage II sporulation protein M [Candidatus Aenigmarchaeota archaeon]
MFISYFIFKENLGIFNIVLISLVLVTFINSMMVLEEKETETQIQKSFLEKHGDIISAFAAMFIGMTLAMSLAFIILPEQVVEKMFYEQIREINIIQGKFTFGSQFMDIVANNLSVLMLSFLLSFLIGTGAILILSWNASVLAAAIGMITKSLGGWHGFPLAVLTFLPHGVFEITAYFVGAISGGLISACVIRKRAKLGFILKDALSLLFIAVIMLIIGGLIETFIIVI